MPTILVAGGKIVEPRALILKKYSKFLLQSKITKDKIANPMVNIGSPDPSREGNDHGT